ncbi:MFS transporter [Candidatus Bathyarchaeota archaeon]|nr:MFS transporter [Candidatus Bathyarchaeota archaeon]
MGVMDRLRKSPYMRGRLPHFTLNRLVDALGWNLFSPFWLKHIQSQGAPITAVGGVESLYNLFLLLQLVGGQLSDSIGRKKMMTMSYVLSIVGIALVLAARSWVWLLVPVILWGIADALIDPVTGVYFAEIAGGEEEGTSFSLLSFTWFLPGLFAPTLAAVILQSRGFAALAWILMATEVVAFLILLAWIPETAKNRKPVNVRNMLRTVVETIRPKAGLTAFYAVSLLDAFTYGLYAPFLVIIFTDYLGYTELQSGMLLNVSTLIVTLLLLPVGRLIDAFSSRSMITLYTVIYTLCAAIYLLSGSYILLIAAQFLRGIALSIWNPAYGAYLFASVDQDTRGTYFGNLNALRSLLMLPAPIIGTYILGSYGEKGVFSLVLLCAATMFLVSLRLRPERENREG